MSAEIKINVSIMAMPEKIYQAITTQEGLASWWAKQTIARPEEGFVNVFSFGSFRNEMKVMTLAPNMAVEWLVINSIEEWVGTRISFNLETKGEKTLLRFSHSEWRLSTDTLAGCTYDWAWFIRSLKAFCETGTGMPS